MPKNKKPAARNTAAGKPKFRIKKDVAMGGASRYFVSHPDCGELSIPLGSFLRILGACGYGYRQTCELLRDAGLPVVPPVTRDELASGNYAEGTTPNTVRSQLHSGIAYAKGRSGTVNVNGLNRVHHGEVIANHETAFGPAVRKALPIYVARVGGRGVRESIAPEKKPRRLAKRKAK